MPEFDYRALDSAGRSTSGRMGGASANEVIARLSQQGLTIQSLQVTSGLGAPSAGRALNPIVQGGGQQVVPPINPAQSMPRASIYQSVNGAAPTSASGDQYQYGRAPQKSVTRKRKLTGFFKDYDLWMLLTQMGTILRAGISSTEMLNELSNRRSLKGKARRALAQMAQMTGQGSSLADAMTVYPEIFPDGVVGSTQAGEVGGYLPDALQHTSAQIQASWKVRRHYLWTSLAIFNSIILLPFIPAINGGAVALGDVINGGETTSQAVYQKYLEGFFGVLMGWPLLAVFGITAFFLFVPYIFGRIWFLPMRHGLAARLPLIGRRTRMESSRELSYHLEHLSVAGISPYRSFGLAAEAIPNKVYRDAMIEAAKPMREDMPISAVLPRSLISDDLIDLVRTGEMTGTTGAAFQQIEQLAAGEQHTSEMVLKVKAWVWVVIFVFGVSTIIGVYMMANSYGTVTEAILKDT